MNAPLLDVRDLSASFSVGERELRAVRGVSFEIAPGESVGVVGESGSGKSALMLSLLRLLPPHASRTTASRLSFAGRDVLSLSDHDIRAIRGGAIAIVFQDPLTALNPVLTVGFQIAEVLRWHQGLRGAAARRGAVDLLARVGVPDPERRARQFPHQFSGGMRQRVMIATALAGSPKLLIADEPTTALDVTVQAEIVMLAQGLQAREGMAMIWVTHDLALLARIAHRIMVMYAGRIVEDAPADRVYSKPAHPYTAGLLNSIARIDRPGAVRGRAIPGAPPDPLALGPGCAFAPRCPVADARCRAEDPPVVEAAPKQRVACWKPFCVALDERVRMHQ